MKPVIALDKSRALDQHNDINSRFDLMLMQYCKDLPDPLKICTFSNGEAYPASIQTRVALSDELSVLSFTCVLASAVVT